jgi:hypothetical protein
MVKNVKSRIKQSAKDQNPEGKTIWASHLSSVHGKESQDDQTLIGKYLNVYIHRKSAEALVNELGFLPEGFAMRPRTSTAQDKSDRPMQLFMSKEFPFTQ